VLSYLKTAIQQSDSS